MEILPLNLKRRRRSFTAMIFILTMEEFFTSEIGIDYADVLHKRDLSIPTVHLESDFRKRLHYFDQINIEVRVIHRPNLHYLGV